MASHLSVSWGAFRASCFTKFTLAPSLSALSRAMPRALSEISHADTSRLSSPNAKVQAMAKATLMAMQPLPVPMSRMAGWGRAAVRPATMSQSCSVSGRGMSTPGATPKMRPANGALPVTYCTGSPSFSLVMAQESTCVSAEDRLSTPPHTISVSDMPKRSSRTVRHTAFASFSPYMAASSRHKSLYLIS